MCPIRKQSKPTAMVLALILAGGLLMLPVSAQPADDLSPYESALFGSSHMGEPVSQRLERLEQSVFGEVQSGPESQRKARLIELLGQAQTAASSPPSDGTSGHSPLDTPPVQKSESFSPSPNPAPQQQPDATDYPKVTALERQVFGRDFIRDDISVRLTRLEKRVFGQPYQNMALIDRVDKLLARYPSLNVPVSAMREEVPDNSALRQLPDNVGQLAGSSRDVYLKVDALEERVLNEAHTGELLTERLDRLEYHLFGQSSAGQSVDSRVSHLLRAVDGKDSPAYNSRLRPGLQRRPAYSLPPQNITIDPNAQTGGFSAGNSPPPRQNIQVGAGIGQTSTYQFSPEMIEMLPPDIRAQMSGGQAGVTTSTVTQGNYGGVTSSSTSQSTIIGAPGTVITERREIPVPGYQAYPGYQTYGGAPIQYYNYYGAPGVGVQNQTRTTVIQPDGSAQVYQYQSPGVATLPNGATVLPNPAYVGDPAFLQEVNNLEISVFGRAYTMDSVSMRLARLETAMTGAVYTGYPDVQRLDNLQKTYRMQSIGRLLGKGKAGDVGRAAGSAVLGVPLTPPAPVVPPQ